MEFKIYKCFILPPMMDDASLQPPIIPGVGGDFGRWQGAGNKILLLIIEAHLQPIIQKASVPCSFNP